MKKELRAANLFDGIYKDLWKEIVPEGLTQAEVEFILRVGNLNQGCKVLDIMCGYGRHALGLASNGVHVTAVDSLSKYIQSIEESNASSNITAILSDIRDLEIEERFDSVICMGNSFSSFNRNEAVFILKKVFSLLKPKGVFILNTWMISEIICRKFKEREWFQINGFKYILENRWLLRPTRIQTTHLIISENGSTESKEDMDYIFSFSEIDEIFKTIGFKLGKIYSTPRMKEFAMGDEYAYIIASKD